MIVGPMAHMFLEDSWARRVVGNGAQIRFFYMHHEKELGKEWTDDCSTLRLFRGVRPSLSALSLIKGVTLQH